MFQGQLTVPKLLKMLYKPHFLRRKMHKMRKTKLYMDTVVDIQVVSRDKAKEEAEAKMDLAFEAFRNVEQACSRFSRDSELMTVCREVEKPVQISPFLFEPLKLALE